MIKVTDKYYISVDSSQFTVYERRVAKSGNNAGQDTFLNATYYGTLAQAVNNVFKRVTADKLSTDEIMPLFEAVNKINEVKAELQEVLDEITRLNIV